MKQRPESLSAMTGDDQQSICDLLRDRLPNGTIFEVLLADADGRFGCLSNHPGDIAERVSLIRQVANLLGGPVVRLDVAQDASDYLRACYGGRKLAANQAEAVEQAFLSGMVQLATVLATAGHVDPAIHHALAEAVRNRISDINRTTPPATPTNLKELITYLQTRPRLVVFSEHPSPLHGRYTFVGHEPGRMLVRNESGEEWFITLGCGRTDTETGIAFDPLGFTVHSCGKVIRCDYEVLD